MSFSGEGDETVPSQSARERRQSADGGTATTSRTTRAGDRTYDSQQQEAIEQEAREASAELINEAMQLLESFRPTIDSPDGHIYKNLGEFDENEDFDKVFIQQAFYGCLRYKKVLEVFLSALYHVSTNSLQRGDYTRLKIFAYLILFRLDELGMSKLSVLLNSQEVLTMVTLMEFVFDRPTLEKWCKEEWCKFLDRTFIEKDILARLERHRKRAEKWIVAKQSTAYSGGTVRSSSKDGDESQSRAQESKPKTTEPKPFNLTQPRPRFLPEPEKIPKKIQANEVPSYIHKKSLKEIEEERKKRTQENAEKTKKKYQNAKAPRFSEIRRDTEKLKQQIEAERDRELQFDKPKANPVPEYPEEGADIKMNVAAILREEALFRKRQKEEAKTIEEYEANLRDSSEFEQWQKRLKEAEEEEQRELIEARKKELEKAAENASKALEQQQEENRRVASAMREERNLGERYRKLEKQAEIESNRAVAEEVKEVRQTAPRAAKEEVVKKNKQRSEAVRREIEEEEEKLKKQREEEQKEREELIRQIRALERVPKKKYKEFDPTTTSGAGLLDEMSLIEMRERLSLLKAREVEEEEERRQAIRQEKRQKEESIKEKVNTIKRVRESASKQNRQARKQSFEQKEQEEREKKKQYDQSCLSLAEKLAQKREKREAEQKALEQESEEIRRKNMFLGEAKKQREEKHFEDYINAQERDIRSKQEQAKIEQKQKEAMEAKERLRKLRFEKMQKREKAEKEKNRQENAKQAAEEAEEFIISQRDQNKRQFFAQSSREERLHATEELAEPFTASVRNLRQDEARARRGGPPRQQQHLETLRQRFNRMNQTEAENTGLVDTVKRSTKAKEATLRRLGAMNEKDVSGVLGKSGSESLRRTRDELAVSMRTTHDLGTTFSSSKRKPQSDR
eukprot:gb/GECG01006373.1/.p1 GENE.gb/GECG01006373.1/~~gb/GECG01006373.1/.p1  ORF type:complete len:910 (+),score=221.53 gb/GECG01006373.1/:1-2730(+)